MAEPRYETARELGQRIGHTDTMVCTECGAFVMNKAAHTRFHATLTDCADFDTWSAEAIDVVYGTGDGHAS